MKHKIKKNRLKIFIALSLMITCVFGVMFATNTFAYETDTFSYTIDDITTNSQNVSIAEFNNTTIISGYNTNATFNLVMNELTYYEESNYLMINYKIEKSTDNVNWSVYQINPSSTNASSVSMTTNFVNNNVTIGNSRNTYIQNLARFYVMSKGYYSNVIPIYSVNTTNFQFDTINIILNSNVVGSSYWRITIYNIDIVGTSKIGLPQYYETYYAQIEENYNQLLEDYNTLSDNYSDLDDMYDELRNDYNDLQDNYNTLEENYNELNGANTNGIWNLFNGFKIIAYNGQDIQNATTIQDTVNFDTFNANGYVNGIDIDITNAKTNNPNYDNYIFIAYYNNNANDIKYTLNDIYLNIPNGNIDNFGIQTANSIYLQTNILLNANQLQEINFNINYNNIINVSNYYNNDTLAYALIFNFIGTNNDNYIVRSTNNQYTIGYVNGFQNGFDSRNTTISYYNTIVEEQTQRINTLQQEINILNGQIDTLTNDDYNLNNLMWTIGSVPFESFKQIWNVNFFGVNLADFFLGFVTFFIALFVVKKFFL